MLRTIEAEEFSTLTPGGRRSYQDSLGPIRTYFVEQLKDPPVDKIVAKHITGYLSWRRVHPLRGTEPLSNRTLQKDRSILHRIFAFAEEMEWSEGNPVRRVKSPKVDARDPVLLSEEQYEALLAACADHPMLQLYALCLGALGARCNSEVLWLRWEHVDLEEGFVWIGQERRAGQGRERHRTKSGKGRWVPMTARLRDGMKAHFAAYRFGGSSWIFHHEGPGAPTSPASGSGGSGAPS